MRGGGGDTVGEGEERRDRAVQGWVTGGGRWWGGGGGLSPLTLAGMQPVKIAEPYTRRFQQMLRKSRCTN